MRNPVSAAKDVLTTQSIGDRIFWWIMLILWTFTLTQCFYQKSAIKAGAAQYNKETGDFEWIKKVEK